MIIYFDILVINFPHLFPSLTDPKKILVFEDAPSGVEAANAAGMHVIAVPDKNSQLSLFSKVTILFACPCFSYIVQADQILPSLCDFKPEEWHLPPFDKS
jgi:beta-phosphoglucomutase-like phosphatase (HAD superfamily)